MSKDNAQSAMSKKINLAIDTAEENIELCEQLKTTVSRVQSSYDLDSDQQRLFSKVLSDLDEKSESFEEQKELLNELHDMVSMREMIESVGSDTNSSSLTNQNLTNKIDQIHKEMREKAEKLRKWENRINTITPGGKDKNKIETNDFGELLENEDVSEPDHSTVAHCPKCGTDLSKFDFEVQVEFCPQCGADV